MKILFVSGACSEKRYEEHFKRSSSRPGQQGQKYMNLLIQGIRKNSKTEKMINISAVPMNRDISSKIFYKIKNEHYDDMNWYYIPIVNIPIIKNILNIIQTLIMTLLMSKECYIICDGLCLCAAIGGLLAGTIRRRKKYVVVTDLPEMLAKNKKSPIVKLHNYILKKYDGFIVLTKEMNRELNKRGKPYVVIEGIADINMQNEKNLLQNKYDKLVCLYSGGIEKKYGLDYLVQGFIEANVTNSELHLYGKGNFVKELKHKIKNISNIKYGGEIINSEIIQKQIKATLLINPRRTDEEYTKYSFPSKNIEYMVSGTPMLTTQLPGMPKEYIKYVFLIKKENAEGIKKDLKELLNLPREELHKKGIEAKKWVLENKNNLIQGDKVLRMIEKG